MPYTATQIKLDDGDMYVNHTYVLILRGTRPPRKRGAVGRDTELEGKSKVVIWTARLMSGAAARHTKVR